MHAALAAQPMLARYASDPDALDAFCDLAARSDDAGVGSIALGAACADPDAIVAAVASALLQWRSILGISIDGQARGDRPEAAPWVDGLTSAFSLAAARRATELTAPRSVIDAIRVRRDPVVRMLRAAFSDEDDATVEALAPAIDVRAVRAASRAAGGRPLRVALSGALGAVGGGSEREEILSLSKRLDDVRRCARRKRSMLASAIAATGDVDPLLSADAAAADAVWESIDDRPDAATRVRVFCDAVDAALVDGMRVAPRGCARTRGAIALRFSGREPMPVALDALARAVDVVPDAFVPPSIGVRADERDAASAWLIASIPRAASFAWPPRDPPAPVAAGPMTFSASRLNGFVSCPRRWFYEYLCDAVEERPSVHAAYGKAFHAALEALHTTVRDPAAFSAEEITSRLCAALDAAFGRSRADFASQLEYEVMRLRARQVATHYVRWLMAQAHDAPFEVADLESRHALSIGDHRFVGYIDRIDRPRGGGPVTIFDYKTGRIEEDPDEYVRRIRRGDEAQLPLYWAMARARGDEIARMALVSLRDARDETWMLAVDVVGDHDDPGARWRRRPGIARACVTHADLEASLATLTARCTTLESGLPHYGAGDDPPCSYCTYERSCRERPDDGERIFAR